MVDVTDPEAMGFPEGVSGHELTFVNETVDQYYHRSMMRYQCGCGQEFTGYTIQSGKISQSSIGLYRNHLLAAVADPQDEITVGKVTKGKVEWVVKVIHREHPSAAAAVSTSSHQGYYNGWLNPQQGGYQRHYPWAILVERYSRKGTVLKQPMKLQGTYRTQSECVSKARNLISKEADRGASVEYTEGSAVPTVLPTFKTILSTLLSDAESAASGTDLNEVKTVLDQLDRVLSLVDVIKARRDELAAVMEQRILRLLDQ